MDTAATGKHKGKPFAFKHLSIQQRLPLFICILLLTIILAFSWISYIGVKNASVEMGSERLTTLADKLTAIFEESINFVAKSTETVAGEKSVKDYLTTGDKQARLGAVDALTKFQKKDSLRKVVQLLDSQKQNVLSLGVNGARLKLDIDSLTPPHGGTKGFISIGKIILYKDSMYYPIVARVTDKDKTIGYFVTWELMKATQKSIDQLAQLLGSNGKMYFGNDDGKFWTDLMRPVAKPPVDLSKLRKVAQYSRKDGEPLIGSMRNIANSHWLILVELSGSSFMKTANIFLRWVIIIGVVLVIVGSLGGWVMSRNITNPLKKLSKAASAIADGDYSSPVDIDRQDELGKLAESFNIMAARVRAAQQELEQKVEDRTKQLETAITDINDQKENEKKKDEFISIASHELKTPLTTLKAFFQLTTKEVKPEFKSFKFIVTASRQLNRMERLIEDLLDVSKINSGKMQYNIEVFDFDEALKDAVDSVQEISPRHKLILKKSANVTVSGDRQRIEQVIINLLNNAVKYSPEADIVLIQSELRDGSVFVTVTDFGIGIEKRHLSELFEKFYRIDIQHRFQGLGLGLFISSEIIKRHGGNIWVDSEPGTGSVFTFQLPVKITADKTAAAIHSAV